ncbi:hypothetical protein [Bombilactobacillus mellifer]|uniref:hypothetical protein n=1 Tax=Bombilactobacillus mellifer TaxID=1218492 RepID=UPI00061AA50D|nr:hypothetical protein [Bombilactobacillus mellifer]
MEHNADRIFGIILVLAIGALLYAIFKPGFQTLAQSILSKMTDFLSSVKIVDSVSPLIHSLLPII